MGNLDKRIDIAKSAIEFTKGDNAIVRYPNVASAHINGLANMVIQLCADMKQLQNDITLTTQRLENANSDLYEIRALLNAPCEETIQDAVKRLLDERNSLLEVIEPRTKSL